MNPSTPYSSPQTPLRPATTACSAKGLFAGRTLWVTGGGSGIGRCTAHELASLGARVVISGRTAEKLDRVAQEIREDGGQCDTRHSTSVTKMP